MSSVAGDVGYFRGTVGRMPAGGFGPVGSMVGPPADTDRSMVVPGFGRAPQPAMPAPPGGMQPFAGMMTITHPRATDGTELSEEPINQAVAVHCRSQEEMNTALPEEILFVRAREKMRKTADSVVEALSLSALNAYLRSYAGRREYGHDLDCMRLRRHWRFHGIMNTKGMPQQIIEETRVVSSSVGRNARITDYWRVCSSETRILDRLYLVLRRFRAPQSAARLFDGEGDDDFDMSAGDGEVTPYFWQFVPWSSTASGVAKPPPQAYMNMGAFLDASAPPFVGDSIYIGKVVHRYGTASMIENKSALAAAVTFPPTATGEGRERAKALLPTLLVSVRVE